MEYELLEMLEESTPVTVEFRTKRGRIRAMTCTRNFGNVPEEQRHGIKTPVLNQPGIVAVYDLLVSDWRAFRLDSIISYERSE
jgi:hypothetical protein